MICTRFKRIFSGDMSVLLMVPINRSSFISVSWNVSLQGCTSLPMPRRSALHDIRSSSSFSTRRCRTPQTPLWLFIVEDFIFLVSWAEAARIFLFFGRLVGLAWLMPRCRFPPGRHFLSKLPFVAPWCLPLTLMIVEGRSSWRLMVSVTSWVVLSLPATLLQFATW